MSAMTIVYKVVLEGVLGSARCFCVWLTPSCDSKLDGEDVAFTVPPGNFIYSTSATISFLTRRLSDVVN